MHVRSVRDLLLLVVGIATEPWVRHRVYARTRARGRRFRPANVPLARTMVQDGGRSWPEVTFYRSIGTLSICQTRGAIVIISDHWNPLHYFFPEETLCIRWGLDLLSRSEVLMLFISSFSSAYRPKLSDPEHGTHQLQTLAPGRACCSAWLDDNFREIMINPTT